MIGTEDVRRLARFDGDGAPVLSVYLDVRPERQLERAYLIAFKDLVRDARDGLDQRGREALEREAARVRAWLEDTEPGGEGAIAFSSTERDLWVASFVPVAVRDALLLEAHPVLAPLLELTDEYEPYVVAAVDRRSAHLYSVALGAIEERDSWKDFVPGRHDQGGYSQPNYERHVDTHAERHLARVAEWLGRAYEQERFDRLVIAGPEEATTALRPLLPRPVADRVVAVVRVDREARPAEILERTLAAEADVERNQERQMVDGIVDAIGGRTACGLDETLESVWLREAFTLVVSTGSHPTGVECGTCGRLTPGRPATCPACGSPIDGTVDLVEAASRRVLAANDGTVEIVHDAAAERLDQVCGGFAASLRFR